MIKFATALLVTTLMTGSAQAQAGRQFDLICPLTTSMGGRALPSSMVRVRIDLDRQLWCDGNCSVARNLIVLPNKLSYVATNSRLGDRWEIDRSSGFYYRNLGGAEMRGTCSIASFTPMPTNQF